MFDGAVSEPGAEGGASGPSVRGVRAALHRVARGRHLWQVAWAGAVAAGIVLIALVNYVHVSPYLPYTGPTIVSWGELPVSAGFLVLGALMIALLTGAARSESRRAP